jgi:ABC-type uncharacterized transport system fused permease/ATPase subunit
MLINGLLELRSAIGCFTRLEKFLQGPARRDTRTIVSSQNISDHSTASNAVVMDNASFGWKEEEQLAIKNVNIRVPPSSVVMITGPVACGKSTLLKGLLGETPVSEGRVEVSSSDVAWCEQSPWLMVSCRPLPRRIVRPLTVLAECINQEQHRQLLGIRFGALLVGHLRLRSRYRSGSVAHG